MIRLYRATQQIVFLTDFLQIKRKFSFKRKIDVKDGLLKKQKNELRSVIVDAKSDPMIMSHS